MQKLIKFYTIYSDIILINLITISIHSIRKIPLNMFNPNAKIKIYFNPILTLLWLGLLFVSVFAQNASKNIYGLSLEELMNIEVTTSAKMEQKQWEASSQVVVITADEIQQRGYQDLTDVLRDLPYFQIQSEYGHWTKGAIVNVRGHRSGDTGNNKFLIMLDGLKLSDDAEEGIYMGMNSIPVAGLKQIEIVYGPNSTLYGKDAYAAMINLISFKENHVLASADFGTYKSRNVHFGLTKVFSEILKGHLLYSDYSSDEQNPIGISTTYINRHVFPDDPYTKRFYRASKNSMLNFGFSIYGFSAQYVLFSLQGSETYGGNPDFYVSEYSTQLKQINRMDMMSYEHDILKSLRLKVYATNKRYEFDPQTANLYIADLNRPPRLNPVDSTLVYDPFYAYGGRKYYYFKTHSYQGGLKTIYKLEDHFSNVTGIEYKRVRGIPVISEGKGGKPISTRAQQNALEHRFTETSLYSEFSYYFCNNILATAGSRFDMSSMYGSVLMSRLGVVFKPETQVFKFIFAQGYLAPSISQRYFESVTNFSWIRPNNNLRPERNTDLDFVWDYLGDSFRLSTNIFYNKLTDGIQESVTTGDSAQIVLSGDSLTVPILQSKNVGSGYRWGFSFGLTKQFLKRKVELSLNYSYLDGKDELPGENIPLEDNLTSRHTVNGALQINYHNYGIYLAGNWASSRRIISHHAQSAYANLVDANGYDYFKPVLLVNAHITANHLAEHLSAYLHIHNLFNTEYYGQTINAEWGSPRILQNLRRITIGVRYQY